MNGATERPCFEFGLVLAGAVSAGAYTAGVLDFLIEALDRWTAAKAAPGYVGPSHDVMLRVLTGASAGAMTSAIAAVALQSEITPVADVDHPPEGRRNRFYNSWVRRVDATALLRDEDIRTSGKVMSALDCSELDRIASDALKTDIAPAPRAYVADPLAVFLTVANLRGVPYSFDLLGADRPESYGMLNHADHMRFAVTRSGQTIPAARQLDPAAAPDGEWPVLAQSALASGAFPIGLRSRVLSRPYGDFDDRFSVPPFWPSPRPAEPYEFLCVDGGLMNNEPLELARRYLAEGARNPREGVLANRAVVMVDPFPNHTGFVADFVPDDRIAPVVSSMFASLVHQARFKPEELELANDPDVYSRFLISPSRVDANNRNVEPAMASAILGGFGGFLAERFRRHDFQLGRRNCQNFLRRHFCLPESNPLFHGWTDPASRAQFYLRDAAGQTERFTDSDPTPLLPIIPLVAGVEREIPQYAPPRASDVDLDTLVALAEARLKTVGASLIDNELKPLIGGSVMRWVARLGFNNTAVPKIRAKLRDKVATQLALLG